MIDDSTRGGNYYVMDGANHMNDTLWGVLLGIVPGVITQILIAVTTIKTLKYGSKMEYLRQSQEEFIQIVKEGQSALTSFELDEIVKFTNGYYANADIQPMVTSFPVDYRLFVPTFIQYRHRLPRNFQSECDKRYSAVQIVLLKLGRLDAIGTLSPEDQRKLITDSYILQGVFYGGVIKALEYISDELTSTNPTLKWIKSKCKISCLSV